MSMNEVLVLLSYNWPGNVREVERVGRLLLREKWSSKMAGSDSAGKFNEKSPKLYYLDPRDVSFNPDASEEFERDLAGWNVDLEFLEALLNRHRVGICNFPDNIAFPELHKTEKTDIFHFSDEYALKIYQKYEPFQDAHKGFSIFCGLFLQDPSADVNILGNLDNSDFKYFSINELEAVKSKKRQVDRLIKSIMKYLNRIDEDYRGPDNIAEFWYATEELKRNCIVEHQYVKHAQLLRDPEELEEIWFLDEPELLRFYYRGLLRLSGGNVTEAAKMAGLKPTTFRERLKKFKVEYKRTGRTQ